MNTRKRLAAIIFGAAIPVSSAVVAEQWVCPTASISAASQNNGRLVQNLGQPIIGRAELVGLSGASPLTLRAGVLACYRVLLIADFDGDGVVSLLDYQLLFECLTGPDPAKQSPDCAGADNHRADFDQDGDVDAHDFAVFQRNF